MLNLTPMGRTRLPARPCRSDGYLFGQVIIRPYTTTESCRSTNLMYRNFNASTKFILSFVSALDDITKEGLTMTSFRAESRNKSYQDNKFWSTSSPPERLAGRRDDVNLNKSACGMTALTRSMHSIVT